MKIEKILLYTSPALFVASLFLPAMMGGGKPVAGIQLLSWGWLAVVFMMFAWYANIFGLIAFIVALKKDYKWGTILAVIATLLGSQTFFLIGSSIDITGVKIDYLGIGFYCWILSFILILASCTISLMKIKK